LDTGGREKEIVILGGGLAGLTAGYFLTRAGHRVRLFESDSSVGGLSKTIESGHYRFDLGGHRFFTKNKNTEDFVRQLMNGELISVTRKSKIYMRSKYFEYPLKPLNAAFGLGIPTTAKIILDYWAERLKTYLKKPEIVSLEDWVVSNFGRALFNLYFREYSEKVWGADCGSISSEWVSQRIKGLSLGVAIKNALFKLSGKDIATLADRFLYPSLGIGRISEKLMEGINGISSVSTNTRVARINHRGFRVEDVTVCGPDSQNTAKGDEFVSTIPVTTFLKIMRPGVPEDVSAAASCLRYRDLIIVAVMLNRRSITDQTWIYIPEKKIPFGRIHEPKNWSAFMAPEGKTLIVAEYFCFEGDGIWNTGDKELESLTAFHLEALGFISKKEVIGSSVVRVPKAYPFLDVGYKKHYNIIFDYLKKFKNLHTTGRTGMFRYYNMDHTIEAGMEIAGSILGKSSGIRESRSAKA
jgi:protoporphyrinogen oxidase